ncbi:hypothetical protein PN435_15180, partial [Nodularia spumigena CS-590/02]
EAMPKALRVLCVLLPKPEASANVVRSFIRQNKFDRLSRWVWKNQTILRKVNTHETLTNDK